MSYVLFISSGVDVTFDPEYDFRQTFRKRETRARTHSGREFVYRWGDYRQWKFSVKWVDSNFASIVNSWWTDNTELLFMDEDDTTQVYSVRLEGSRSPMTSFIKPYKTFFKGKIELGTY